VAIDLRDRHAVPVGLQPPHGPEHGLVLRGPGEDACLLGEPASDAEDGEVHGFGPRGRERDLSAVRVQLLGEEVAGAIEGGAGGAALGVEAGRIGRRQVAERCGNLREDRRRGRVVEIDAALRGRAGGGDGRQPRL
jgi:hypothetical protein